MPQTRVGIIGLGQGGKALAVHLASRGYKPLIYCVPGHRKEYEAVKKRGGLIEATHAIQGVFEVQLVDDLAEFVRRTDHIVIVTLSTAHRAIIQELSRHDLSKTNLVALPGGGSFAAKVQQLGLKARNVLESCTLPYASRSPGPGQVAVLYIKRTFPLASAKSLQDADRTTLSAIFADRVDWHRSILSIWLNCTNPIVHCPPMVLNAGRVESGDPFCLYGDGITPGVAKATLALDAERLAIAASIGEKAPTVLEWTNIWYDAKYPDWVTFARTSMPHNKHGLAPTKLKGQRYLDEDMKETMVLWYSLGQVCGLDLPVMRSMLTLTSTMVDEDYLETGATLQSLGLHGKTKEQLMEMFGPHAAPHAPRSIPNRATHQIPASCVSPGHSKFTGNMMLSSREVGLLGMLGQAQYRLTPMPDVTLDRRVAQTLET